MPIPGYSQVESGSSWQSTVPGWVAPSVDPRIFASPITLSLAGITVESQTKDRQDFRSLHSLEGWWEAPETRVESMPIPDGDGELEGRVLLGARPIAAAGLIVTRDRTGLLEEMERFGSILTTGARRGDLVVRETERDLSRQCRVSAAQPPVVVPHSDRVASWSWSLRAADPIRYEATPRYLTLQIGRTADGIIENVGNAGVPLTVQLFGPMTKPSVWIDGVKWTLDYTIAARASVIAYFNDREVWSGSSSLRYFQSGPWPPMKPGVTPIGLSAASTTGSARFSWRSGWL